MASKPITRLSAVISLCARSRAFRVAFASPIFPYGRPVSVFDMRRPRVRRSASCPMNCRYRHIPRHHPIASLSLRLNRCDIHRELGLDNAPSRHELLPRWPTYYILLFLYMKTNRRRCIVVFYLGRVCIVSYIVIIMWVNEHSYTWKDQVFDIIYNIIWCLSYVRLKNKIQSIL